MQEQRPIRNNRSLKECVYVALKGFCMGVADVVPGISGGTIAFITGIYEDLIEGIKSFNWNVLKCVLSGRIKEAVQLVSWQFLLSLVTGIFLAIFSLASVISWLLEHKPVLLNAFFLGLIIGSVWVIAKTIKQWSVGIVVAIAVSAGIAYSVFGMVPMETPTHPLFLFVCGFIAICAMVLPGISGSFLLLVMGKYEYVIHAVKDRDFMVLIVFAAGCAVGLLSFVRVVSWTLKRYHNQTIAVLTGLVIGALRKIWPWKETLSTRIDRHGDVIPFEQINVWPQFTSDFFIACILILTGVVCAMLLGREPKKEASHV